MIRSSTATAILAISLMLATGASAHDYYPEKLSWSQKGDNCVVRFFVKSPPANVGIESGRNIHDVGINWCVAHAHIKGNWTQKNGGLGDAPCWTALQNSPRWGSLGRNYLTNQQDKKISSQGDYWEAKVPISELGIDSYFLYPTTEDVVRFILSVNFYTGSTHHHHDGSHTFSTRVPSSCD